MTTTWNPSDKNAGITLSGGNLIATSSAGSGTVNQAVRATAPISPAVAQYFEVTVGGTVGQYLSIGVMDNSSIAGNVGIGNPGTGAGYLNKGQGATSSLYRNGVQNGNYPALVAGQIMRVAVNRAVNKAWWAINNNTWSGSAVWMGSGATTDDPATWAGGLDISAVAKPTYAASSSAWTNDTMTVKAAAPFTYTVPSGYSALDTTLTNVNTIFNDNDAAASIYLSGSRLTAISASNGNFSVRALDSRSSGKYYFEYTFTQLSAGFTSGVGIERNTCSLSVSVASLSGGITGACGVDRNGSIAVDGANSGVSLGAVSVGTALCVAIDLTAQRVWFRLGAAGNWNASGTANPATATGGIAIPNLGGGVQSYPAVTVTNANDTVVANFGDSTFVGAVPGGFNAGFPGTAAIVTTQALAMVLA